MSINPLILPILIVITEWGWDSAVKPKEVAAYTASAGYPSGHLHFRVEISSAFDSTASHFTCVMSILKRSVPRSWLARTEFALTPHENSSAAVTFRPYTAPRGTGNPGPGLIKLDDNFELGIEAV